MQKNPVNLNAKRYIFPPSLNQHLDGLSSSSPSTARPCAADRRTTSGKTNTPSTDVSAAEHGRVAEHVGDDEEAYVRAANVNLIEMRDATVAGGDGNVLELDVHVILSCRKI